ncbi:DNA-binding IclR family transcriptional regulator [Actinopolyspora biskrensis]|uniref:DNA-binding IclR family transcriptional regulator n=1 Tax=Actinopolyspora biskrensis TaxID=1470178 RepID=A0A852YUG1_9ACTN|nr:helix-turn-helix domain-containing protein [Actinopolyspora biskrensis]NYH77700.1 DNA-binding IclR family transcriptional regulator [Actinopolyspora biskrensis]
MTGETGERTSDSSACSELRVIDRTFELLRILNSESFPLTLKELSDYSGIPKSSTHRLLNALVGKSLVQRIGDAYQADHGVVGFGGADGRVDVLRAHLSRCVAWLCETTGYTAELSVMIGAENVVLCRVGAPGRVWRVPVRFDRAPAHTTASGKVLLAHDRDTSERYIRTGYFHATEPDSGISSVRLLREFDEVRREMIAFSESPSPAVRSAAVPVWGDSASPAAALSLVSDRSSFRDVLARQALLGMSRRGGELLRRRGGSLVDERCLRG